MKEKEERSDFFENLYYWLPLPFLGVGLLTFFYLNTPREFNSIFITAIGILLGFLAIFYPLIIKKEILEKRKVLIKDKFTNLSKSLRGILTRSEERVRKKDYLIIEEDIEEMSSCLDNFSNINLKANIDNHLFKSFLFLILALLLLVVDLVFPAPHVKDLYFIKILGIFFFLGGAYKSLIVLYSWRVILSQR